MSAMSGQCLQQLIHSLILSWCFNFQRLRTLGLLASFLRKFESMWKFATNVCCVTLNKLLTRCMHFVHQVGSSEPLESLPETHSLALVAENSNSSLAVEMSNASTTSKPGDGEFNCRLPLPSPCDGQ